MFLFCLRPLFQPSVVCCDASRFRLITRAAPLLFLYAVNFTFKLEKVIPKIENREKESEWFKLRFCFLFEPGFAFYRLHFWLVSVAFGLADHEEAIAREKGGYWFSLVQKEMIGMMGLVIDTGRTILSL